MNAKNRIAASVLTAAFALASAIVPTPASAQTVDVRIGYQRGSVFSYLKQNGTLEKVFGSGYNVTWTLFPAGPQTLEAVNAGSIDFTSTGDAPPIFAQAAGVPLVYVASQTSAGGQSIIVPENSTLQSIADLKGKKVAYNPGSSAHYLLVQALESEGIAFSDVESLPLAPADARAAFESGSIDAWVIWDPFLTIAIDATKARVLVDGTAFGLRRSYFLAATAFVEKYPDAVNTLLEEIQKATDDARTKQAEFITLVESETQIPAAVWEKIFPGTIYDLEPLTEDIIAQQQAVADTFYSLKLIPNDITIRDAAWLKSNLKPEILATSAATLEATAEATSAQ